MKSHTVMALVVGALVFGFVGGYLFTSIILPATLPIDPVNEIGEDVTMSAMMHDMSASLDGKTGAEFDAQFLSDMIVHHEGATDMANKALAAAEDPRIKDLAAAIIEAQEREIAAMKSWQKPDAPDSMNH